MTEEKIRRELAAGNPVCPECSNAIMEPEYDSQGNRILVCPNCDYDIEEDMYDYIFEDEFYGEDEPDDEPDEGCIACGCSAYPQCKSSCGRFDD